RLAHPAERDALLSGVQERAAPTPGPAPHARRHGAAPRPADRPHLSLTRGWRERPLPAEDEGAAGGRRRRRRLLDVGARAERAEERREERAADVRVFAPHVLERTLVDRDPPSRPIGRDVGLPGELGFEPLDELLGVRSFVAASEPMAPALGETLGRGADDLLDGTRPVPLEEHLDDQTEEQVIPLGKDPGALRGEPIEE